MPTNLQITSASDTLTESAQAQALALIRQSDRYKAHPEFYRLPAAAIASASGTIKGRQINATLTLIDKIADGTIALLGGEKGLDYDKARDRNQLVEYLISVIYEQPPRHEIRTVHAINERVF